MEGKRIGEMGTDAEERKEGRKNTRVINRKRVERYEKNEGILGSGCGSVEKEELKHELIREYMNGSGGTSTAKWCT